MILHAVTHNAAFTVISRFRTWCAFVGCWLVSVNGIAQQVFVAPGVTQVPVNRIQAPGYIPPPPVVRRPWCFTVQTVSGPGAVVPVPRVTRYQPPALPISAGGPRTCWQTNHTANEYVPLPVGRSSTDYTGLTNNSKTRSCPPFVLAAKYSFTS